MEHDDFIGRAFSSYSLIGDYELVLILDAGRSFELRLLPVCMSLAKVGHLVSLHRFDHHC